MREESEKLLQWFRVLPDGRLAFVAAPTVKAQVAARTLCRFHKTFEKLAQR